MQDFLEEKYMDNSGNGNLGNQNLNKPLSLDDDLDKPIPLDDIDTGNAGVSHSPLDLGGSHPAGVQKIPKPQPKPAAGAAPIVNMASQAISGGRISPAFPLIRTSHIRSHGVSDRLTMARNAPPSLA